MISLFNNSGKKLLLLLIILAGCQVICHAQPSVQKTSAPVWIDRIPIHNEQPDPRKISYGYYIKLYNQQVHVENQTEYTQIQHEIVESSGVQSGSEIWVTFLPSHQTLQFHELYIIRDGAQINKLPAAQFKIIAAEQESSSFVYNDSHSAYLLLEDIRVGDIISYAYSIIGFNPVFEGKFSKELYLQYYVPVAQFHHSILVSSHRNITYKLSNGAPEPKKESLNSKMTKYIWTGNLVDASEYEAYAPSWWRPYSFVQMTEFSSWEEVANWAGRINPIPEKNSSAAIRDLAATWLTEVDGDQKKFANKAIRYVQDEIRYTAVVIGEHSHRSNPPPKVLAQRYGDCKDKSMLLISLLREADIEADLTLVSTEHGSKLDDQLPSPLAFDHAIVTFIVAGKRFFTDPTISHQGGDLDQRSVPNYGRVLIINSEEPKIWNMKSLNNGETIVEENFVYQEDQENTAILNVKTVYTGHEADAIRSSLSYTSIWDLEKQYLDFYSRLFPQIKNRNDIQVADDREVNQIIILEEYLIENFLDRADGRYFVEFYASTIADKLPDISTQRIAPLSVRFPGTTTHHINLILKGGLQIPEDHHFVDRDAYVLGSSTVSIGDTIKTTLHFKFHQPEIDLSQISTYTKDVSNFKTQYLSFNINFSDFPSGNDILSLGIHWGVLAYIFLFLVAAALVGRYLLHLKIPIKVLPDTIKKYNRIGGWIIVALILVNILMVLQPFQIFITKWWQASTWQAMDHQTEVKLLFKWAMFFSLTEALLVFTGSIIYLLLLLRKKAIFPRYAVIFYLGMLAFNIISLLMFLIFLNSLEPSMRIPYASVHAEYLSGFGILFFNALIWVPYFIFSKRVKGTFTTH